MEMDSSKQSAPLYGLILAGGRSTRMKRDKAGLLMGDQTLMARTFALLERHCSRVFVSNRCDQSQLPLHRALAQIHDRRDGQGPAGGILAALETHAEAAWLVVACDMPYLDEGSISKLIDERDPSRIATAYANPRDGMPEPLCAIYEPGCRGILEEQLHLAARSPRRILAQHDVKLIEPDDGDVLRNINLPAEYAEAVRLLVRTPRE